MTLEQLENEAYNEGLEIIDYEFSSRIKGIYSRPHSTIAINKKCTPREKKCVIVEELGHHYTSHGDILDQASLNNRKQERTARAWGYDKILKSENIIKTAIKEHSSYYDLALALDVTPEYLIEALKYYQNKKDIVDEVTIDNKNYVVSYYPLMVMPVEELTDEDIFF